MINRMDSAALPMDSSVNNRELSSTVGHVAYVFGGAGDLTQTMRLFRHNVDSMSN